MSETAAVAAPVKKRIDHADTIRGVCILLVNYFHAGVSFFMLKYVSNICVHPFIFMAGYFYSGKASLGDTFKKKFRSMMVPYFILGLMYYLVWLVFSYKPGMDIITPLRAVIFMPTNSFPIEPSLYFLPVMFFGGMLLAVIVKYIKNEYVRCALVIALTLLGNLWNDQFRMRLPLSLDCALSLMLYFYLGFHGRAILEFTDKLWAKLRYNWLKVLVFAALSIINYQLIEYNFIPNILNASWTHIHLCHINTCLLMLLWVYFFRYTENLSFLKGVNRVLKYIGKNSILFMCFSHTGLKISMAVVSRLPIGNDFVVKTLYCVLALLIIVPIVEVINRTKLRFIFGSK